MLKEPHGSYFMDGFEAVQAEHHSIMVEKGFWEGEQNDGEKIALMHEELSEALGAIRHGNPPDKDVPQFSSLEVELADEILRVMDYAEHRKLDVCGALLAKMEFNRTRPPKHGKKF